MLRLEVEYDYEFLLFGISCHEKAYRLCWSLNKYLGLNLHKDQEDICIYHKESQSFHPFFYCNSNSEQAFYSLIKNRAEEGYVIPELPQIDYFFKAEDYFADEEALLKKIRKLSWVNAIYRINASELKSKDNLIFE